MKISKSYVIKGGKPYSIFPLFPGHFPSTFLEIIKELEQKRDNFPDPGAGGRKREKKRACG